MRLETKEIGKKGVFVHTKLSASVVSKIAKLSKEKKATKSAVMNALLKKALK